MLIRLAQVIGACEEHWDRAYAETSADASWCRPSDDSRFYFELLSALDYPLEHIEQLINKPDLDNDRGPHLTPGTEPAETAIAGDVDGEDDIPRRERRPRSARPSRLPLIPSSR